MFHSIPENLSAYNYLKSKYNPFNFKFTYLAPKKIEDFRIRCVAEDRKDSDCVLFKGSTESTREI